MTCYAKGNLRYRTGATTAVIVLMAGGYLTMSGTSAKTEPRESGTEAGKDDGWITTFSTATPANSYSEGKRENETIVPKQYLGGDVSKSNAEEEDGEKPRKKNQSKKSAFRSDPQYEKKYDAEGQSAIYGGKTAVEPPRPLLELGREQYTSGIYDESSTLFGKLNPLLPGLSVYGDWRTAVAYNSNNG
ncbi:MAG: hypothetical protein J0I81_12030, partial [Hyphomicrobium sp.]|nr:hypothetical protein [Hyphomicrobium sp.]